MSDEMTQGEMSQKEKDYIKFIEEELPEQTKIIEREFKKVESSAAKNIKELVAELAKASREIEKTDDKEAAAELRAMVEELISMHPELKELAFLRSILPKNFYVANNKLANEMTKDFVNMGIMELAVIPASGRQEAVMTSNTLTFEGKNISITGRYEFTAYDRAIHNAVCTLYEAGNDVITPIMVYRAVNGMTEQENISPQSLEAVTDSLDKSRYLFLTVDYTEEAKARGYDVDNTKIEGNLLSADKIMVTAGGYEVDAYQINRVPILYEYAQLSKQIIAVPSKLLNTKEAVRNTEKMIPIKEYLLRRIEIMKHDRKMNNKILYETVFKEAGIVIKHSTERDRHRKYIKDILQLWKTRDNYIADFQEYREKNKSAGVEITLPDPSRKPERR